MDSVTVSARTLSFAHGEKTILHELDLDFEPGRLHAIIGPNGSGKTTLLDILAGHRTPKTGSVSLNESEVATHTPVELARLLAMVPQEIQFDFPFTAFDAVLMGRHPHIPRFSRPTDHDLEAVHDAMRTMDITHLARRSLGELSGGEKQRTAFARALAQDTPCLLLDEPTSSMDIRHALIAMKALQRLAREGRTVVTVLHDLNLAATCCDSVTILHEGQLHAQGTPQVVLAPDTIETVFGVNAEIMPHPETGKPVLIYSSKENS